MYQVIAHLQVVQSGIVQYVDGVLRRLDRRIGGDEPDPDVYKRQVRLNSKASRPSRPR